MDFVQISTPPYYHVQHLETVVAAGKHVYCEKPVAIDVPGAKRVIEMGQKMTASSASTWGSRSGWRRRWWHWRNALWDGAIGPIACGEAFYYCPQIDRPARAVKTPDELRLRNWVWYRELSGDIVVEQNIHVHRHVQLVPAVIPSKRSPRRRARCAATAATARTTSMPC